MEEEGGGSSATMVTADDDGGHGGRHPSRCHWQLEVVLPSSALPPSHNEGGLRGAQNTILRRANAVANAILPTRCKATSHRRKT